MKPFADRRAEGTNLENLYKQGYLKGQIEQLEQDMLMLDNIISKSQTYEDFKENLSNEIRRIQLGINP